MKTLLTIFIATIKLSLIAQQDGKVLPCFNAHDSTQNVYNGKVIYKSICYYQNGKIKGEEFFDKNGQRKKCICYDENGNIIDVIVYDWKNTQYYRTYWDVNRKKHKTKSKMELAP